MQVIVEREREREENKNMSCFHPIYMIKRGLKPNGKQDLIFANQVSSNLGLSTDELMNRYKDRLVPVPCGKCIGCRLSHAKEWAVRCVLESMDHLHNSFITLTYDDAHCPKRLKKAHLSAFMKRLRERHPEIIIRFFGCGEYGSSDSGTHRPHYHAIIFGYDFPDKQYWSNDGISALYRSAELEKLWTYGISSVGEVNLESCAYVARYSMKKAKASYGDEFLLMSRRPGIAANFFESHQEIIYLSDHVYGKFGDSHSARVPRYCDKLAEKNGYDLSPIKDARVTRAQNFNQLALYLRGIGHTEQLNALTERILLDKIRTLRRYL